MANDVTINVKTKGTKQAKSAFGELKKGAAALGVGLAAVQVTRFVGDAIAAFSDLTESVNAVNVMYDKSADGVHALGEDSVEAFGLSTTAVNEAAVQMGAFAEIIDKANPDDAFGNILARATDFASVMNLETNVALDKFQSALAGQARPLLEFGINISAAATNAFALRTGIIGVGEQLSDDQKVVARYGLIMEETANTAGDWARTSDELAGSQKKLAARWAEARIELGQKLAPVMATVIQAGTDLIPVFSLLVTEVGAMVGQLKPFIKLLGDVAGLAGQAAGASGEATEEQSLWNQAVGLGTESLQKIFNPLQTYWDANLDIQRALGLTTEATEGVTGAESDMTEALSTTIDRARTHAESMGNVAAATDGFAESNEAAKVTVDDLRAAVDLFNSTLLTHAERLLAARQAGLTEMEFAGREASARGHPDVRQHGGPVTAGAPYLVGEAGAELFVPHRSGVIVSNRDLEAMVVSALANLSRNRPGLLDDLL